MKPCRSTQWAVLGVVARGGALVRCALLSGHAGQHVFHLEWSDLPSSEATTGQPARASGCACGVAADHGPHEFDLPVPVQPQTPAWRWSDDGGEYVRKHYGVPAHTKGRVIADGKPGVIVGFEEQYLRVVLDGETESGKWHPTWHMEYLSAVQPQTEED